MIPFYSLIASDPVLYGLLFDSSMTRVRAFGYGLAQDIESPPMRPYVVWSGVSDTPENNLGNNPCVTDSIIQFDTWGRDGAVVDQIHKALQSLLRPYGYITTIRPVRAEEDETKLFRAGFDFNHLQT